MDLSGIQTWLQQHELDGWLMADFHARNGIATQFWGIDGMLTRRSFYFIPASGEPTGLVHAIEKAKFTGLPGKLIPFSAYTLLEQELTDLLKDCRRVAMEYSPNGRLPYIGLVDAGTIEFIKSLGIEIVSSADLVANFQARLSVEEIAMHRMAAANLIKIKDETFAHISETLRNQARLTEYDVVRYMLDRFEHYDMHTESGPNCSVGAHAGDPHYEPSAEGSSVIEPGQLVLIDLWAKLKRPDSVYGDITWMAFAGREHEIPAEYKTLFAAVTAGRDKAVSFLRENIEKRPVYGYEVDDACRGSIRAAGYGPQFVHRTGHSITWDIHGQGPNIDNLETEDRRRLQKGHLFSIEPGLYSNQYGFRSEIDVLVGHEGIEITTLPLQSGIVPLL